MLYGNIVVSNGSKIAIWKQITTMDVIYVFVGHGFI